MTEKSDDSDVSCAKHDGDIRIYLVEDVDTWIQSDTNVTQFLDSNDSKKDFNQPPL